MIVFVRIVQPKEHKLYCFCQHMFEKHTHFAWIFYNLKNCKTTQKHSKNIWGVLLRWVFLFGYVKCCSILTFGIPFTCLYLLSFSQSYVYLPYTSLAFYFETTFTSWILFSIKQAGHVVIKRKAFGKYSLLCTFEWLVFYHFI